MKNQSSWLYPLDPFARKFGSFPYQWKDQFDPACVQSCDKMFRSQSSKTKVSDQ